MEEELLARFLPVVWVEDEGYWGESRLDFPYDMLAAGSGNSFDVEDNAETFPTAWDERLYTVYGHAEELSDTCGTRYWLLQYFYYLPADYDRRLYLAERALSTEPAFGMKHEHDWEWVCVFVGKSIEADAEDSLAPFIAVLSGHKASNCDLMADPGRHVYLFPRVTVSKEWIAEHDREYIKSTNRLLYDFDNGERAGVSMLSTGNEFSPHLVGYPLSGEPSIVTVPPATWLTEEDGAGGCVDVVSTRTIAFGDSSASEWIWADCAGLGECDTPREVPWMRSGTWGQAAVPEDFIFPAPGDFKLKPKPQVHAGEHVGGSPRLLITPTIVQSGCTIRAKDFCGAVVVLSADGRAQKVVDLAGEAGGLGAGIWGGTDSGGVRVSSGVYFLSVLGRGTRGERVIVLN